jgi:uncharacterized caspase-like protein
MPALFRALALLAALAPLLAAPAGAQTPEQRFALVIGNSEYKAGRHPTAANDAGLVAETLRTAGFDVAGARDLDQDTLRRSIREFIDKVSAAGPQAVSFVYLAGYGVQLEGENYIVPVDATLARDSDIPLEGIRISDLTRALGSTQGAVKFVVIDAARQLPYAPAGAQLAGGFALVEPEAGMLVSFNAAPGTVAPVESGPYGAFAQALTEMIGSGGLGVDDVFARVRLRVNEMTNGVAVPWYASKIALPFLFTERAPDAPPPPQTASVMELQSRPIQQFNGEQEAYIAGLERDTIPGYQEFIAAYPDSPHVRRVRALIAVRREAILWRRVLSLNTREAYWSYLNRYPQGGHVADCERRLAELAADYDPPPAFVPVEFDDVPPPPPDEVVYLTQPVVVFDDPLFVAPPPVPEFFCPPPPPEFVALPPPPPPVGAFFLPAPVLVFFSGPRPRVHPPAFVVAPRPPPVQRITINNTTIINEHRGGVGLMSPALPGAVVTRVNSGALRVPPPAPPATFRVPPRGGAQPHPGVGVLGTTVALPPRVHATPVLPSAAPKPAVPPAAVLPGNAHLPAPNVPGRPQQRPVSPGIAHPGNPPAPAVPHIGRPSPQQQVSRPPSPPPREFSRPAPPRHVSPPPSQQFTRPAPPPQQFTRPAPPQQQFTRPAPPPQQFTRPAPPPPQFTRPAPPPQQFTRPAPPPQAAHPAPQQRCAVVNGKQVCK